MSVPSTAYFDNDNTNLILHKVAVATRAIKFPVFASVYPNPTVFKGKFFCDYLFEIFANNKSTGGKVTVMVAGVVEGGNMASYHAANRLSNLVLKHKPSSGPEVKVTILNDGGLNTLPFTREELETSAFIFDLKIEARFNSAHYLETTQYGFRGRQRNSSNSDWEPWNAINIVGDYGIIPANDYMIIESFGFASERKGVHFQIQPFITNSEGTYYGQVIEILPKAKPIVFYGDSTTYYIDTLEVGVGTKLFDDEDFGGYHQGPTGTGNYYIDARYYWSYGYDVFSDSYMFLELIDSNPPVTPTYFDYTGWSETSAGDAENQVLYNAGQYSGRLWWNTEYDTYWTGWTEGGGFVGVPADGWYSWGDVSGVEGTVYLVDGLSTPY
ncbi:hypothetical protein [Pedobacter sp.]